MTTLSTVNANVRIHRAQKLIKGLTYKLGTPISCEVRAYSRETGEMLSRAKSNLAGQYILYGLNAANYVVAIDPSNQFNAVIQDNVVPK